MKRLLAPWLLALALVVPTGGARAATFDAAALLARTNEQRQSAGLPPLRADAALDWVAAQRANDMVQRRYESHVSPEGLTAVALLVQQPIAFEHWGENFAGAWDWAPNLDLVAYTAALVWESPGHRALVESAAYTRMGSSWAESSDGRCLVVEIFADG